MLPKSVVRNSTCQVMYKEFTERAFLEGKRMFYEYCSGAGLDNNLKIHEKPFYKATDTQIETLCYCAKRIMVFQLPRYPRACTSLDSRAPWSVLDALSKRAHWWHPIFEYRDFSTSKPQTRILIVD